MRMRINDMVLFDYFGSRKPLSAILEREMERLGCSSPSVHLASSGNAPGSFLLYTTLVVHVERVVDDIEDHDRLTVVPMAPGSSQQVSALRRIRKRPHLWHSPDSNCM